MIIGIHAVVQFNNSDQLHDCYMSFGDYDEDNECDSFGIPDDYIFYYLSKEELNKKETMEFKIIELRDYVSLETMH